MFNNIFKKRFQCSICMKKSSKFERLSDVFIVDFFIRGKKYTVNDFETINVDNYICPVCKASDRSRLYWMYLRDKIPQMKAEVWSILHFAPEEQSKKKLSKIKSVKYGTADYMMEGVDHHVDITDLNIFKSSSFNFLICSHILEHVIDDSKAISELYRILKPGSMGIVMVPLIPDLDETYEDISIVSQEDRLKHFGQTDHVRVYSKKDFLYRLKNAGFKVHECGKDYFGLNNFIKYGITEKSVLYIVEKQL